MANRIIVDLMARDFITPAINGIRRAAQALSRPLQMPRPIQQQQQPGGTNPFVQGFATAVAFKGLDVAIQGFQSLSNAINDTAKAQTKLISDAGGFSVLSGLNYDQSAAFFKKLNIDLSATAAKLPGAAKDYTDAATNIASALVGAYNVRTPAGLKQFQKELQETTENVVILSQASGVMGDGGAEFAKRFVSGTSSFAELRLLDFGTKNPAFLKLAKAEFAAQGLDIDQFQKLSEKQRADVLRKITGQLVTPDLKARLSNTADAMMASLKDSIVNPYTGTLGLLREISSQGGRSVMDSFTDMFRISNRLGAQVLRLAKASGLLFDPLSLVISAMDYASDTMLSFERNLARASKVNFYETFAGIGQGLLKMTLDGFMSINWQGIGQAIGAGLVIIAKYFLDFRTWQGVLKIVAMALKGAFELFTGILTGFVSELARTGTGWITKLGQDIKDFFMGILAKIKAPVDAVGGAVGGVFDNINNFARKITGQEEQPKTPATGQPSEPPKPTPKLPGSFFGIQLPSFQTPEVKTAPMSFSPMAAPTVVNPPTVNVAGSPLALPDAPKPINAPSTTNRTSNTTTANTFNVAINGADASNPQALAQLVLDTLSQQYNSYRSNALTA